MAFSPTAPELALSGSEDGTLFLWDVSTGERIRRFEGHTGGINDIAFSPDGSTAVSGSGDQTTILWDVATGQIIRQLTGYSAGVTTVAFSPDGHLIAAGCDTGDPAVMLWETDTGALIYRLDGPAAKIQTVGFRTDDQGQAVVFAYSFDNMYHEWSVTTGMPVRSISASQANSNLALAPNGRTAVTGEGNGSTVLNLTTWDRLAVLFTPSKQIINAIDISPNGARALSGTTAGEVILINLPVSPVIRRFHADGGLSAVAVSPDGRFVVTGGTTSGGATLWDAQTGQEIRRISGYETTVAQIAVSPDSRYALLCFDDVFFSPTPATEVVQWDLDTGDVVHVWTNFAYHARAVTVSPDSRTALVGTMEWGGAFVHQGSGELVLLDLQTGAEIRRFAETGEVLGVSISPDGRRAVAATSVANSVTLWDVTTGQPLRRFDYLSGAVAFTSDPRYFLTGGDGGFVILLDADTGAVVRTYTAPTPTIWSIALSPNQQYVLGAGEQGQVMMWNFQTGALIQQWQIQNVTDGVWNVAISPDGQTAYASQLSPTGEVIQWQIAEWPLERLLPWVQENRYISDFTCEERAQFRIEPLCEGDVTVN